MLLQERSTTLLEGVRLGTARRGERGEDARGIATDRAQFAIPTARVADSAG